MALTVEDGTNIPNANTLVSEAYADAYFLLRGISSWAALTTAEKEASIIRSMDYLSSMSWIGTRTYDDQTLCFPRTFYIFIDGVYKTYSDTIPEDILKAQCEGALRESIEQGSLTPDKTRDDYIIMKKIDVIETEWANPSIISTSFESINKAIKPYLLSGSSSDLRWFEVG